MSRKKRSGAQISGNPLKREVKKKVSPLVKPEDIKRKALMSKQAELKAEIVRLMDLFEEQQPESSEFFDDDLPYMVALGTIATHRLACELSDTPQKYNIHAQLDTLELPPAVRAEIESFLINNRMDKAETWSIVGKASGSDGLSNENLHSPQ